MKTPLLIAAVLSTFICAPASAADGDAAHALDLAVSALAKKLNPDQTRHFYLLYNNDAMIGKVETARHDISRAVDSCSDHNPDMEDEMRGRFKDWTDKIDPPLKKARAKIDRMIDGQTYAKPENIRHILELSGAARAESEKKTDKKPIAAREDCEYMLGKIDDSEDALVSLLNATLLDYPDTLPLEGDAPPRKELITIEPPAAPSNY